MMRQVSLVVTSVFKRFCICCNHRHSKGILDHNTILLGSKSRKKSKNYVLLWVDIHNFIMPIGLYFQFIRNVWRNKNSRRLIRRSYLKFVKNYIYIVLNISNIVL